ncbi:hypothetical protein KEM54_005317, partial [Ascosphaera aggregata]
TQANVIRIPVDRPSMHEITALGAAIAAGFAIKLWTNVADVRKLNASKRRVFTHRISHAQSERMYKKWSKAVEMCRGWVDADEIQQDAKEEEDDEEDEEEEIRRQPSEGRGSERTSVAMDRIAAGVSTMRTAAGPA